MSQKIVLVVEDNSEVLDMYRRFFQDLQIEVWEATSIEDALTFLRRTHELSGIVWDGVLRKTCSFDGAIQQFKRVFNGPMIAASRSTKSLDLQMAAGCTHIAAPIDRFEVLKQVFNQ